MPAPASAPYVAVCRSGAPGAPVVDRDGSPAGLSSTLDLGVGERLLQALGAHRESRDRPRQPRGAARLPRFPRTRRDRKFENGRGGRRARAPSCAAPIGAPNAASDSDRRPSLRKLSRARNSPRRPGRDVTSITNVVSERRGLVFIPAAAAAHIAAADARYGAMRRSGNVDIAAARDRALRFVFHSEIDIARPADGDRGGLAARIFCPDFARPADRYARRRAVPAATRLPDPPIEKSASSTCGQIDREFAGPCDRAREARALNAVDADVARSGQRNRFEPGQRYVEGRRSEPTQLKPPPYPLRPNGQLAVLDHGLELRQGLRRTFRTHAVGIAARDDHVLRPDGRDLRERRDSVEVGRSARPRPRPGQNGRRHPARSALRRPQPRRPPQQRARPRALSHFSSETARVSFAPP